MTPSFLNSTCKAHEKLKEKVEEQFEKKIQPLLEEQNADHQLETKDQQLPASSEEEQLKEFMVIYRQSLSSSEDDDIMKDEDQTASIDIEQLEPYEQNESNYDIYLQQLLASNGVDPLTGTDYQQRPAESMGNKLKSPSNETRVTKPKNLPNGRLSKQRRNMALPTVRSTILPDPQGTMMSTTWKQEKSSLNDNSSWVSSAIAAYANLTAIQKLVNGITNDLDADSVDLESSPDANRTLDTEDSELDVAVDQAVANQVSHD